RRGALTLREPGRVNDSELANVADRLFKAFEEHDFDTVRELCDPEARFWSSIAGRESSVEQLLAYLPTVRERIGAHRYSVMRRPLTLLLAGLLAGATLPAIALTTQQGAAAPPPVRLGAARLTAAPGAPVERAIVELDHIPVADDIRALRGLGLQAQGMGHL